MAGLRNGNFVTNWDGSTPYISKCELGERRIDIVEFYWICEACGATPESEAKKIMKAFATQDKA